MAYKISLSLGRAVVHNKYALTPEDAANVAWQMCVANDLRMPNSSWKMKVWDTFEGQYEENPVTEHMVRGCGGKYPAKVEFMHCAIDQLTENGNNMLSDMIYARSGFPNNKESSTSQPKFEIFRGKDRLLIEYDEGAKWSAVDDLSVKIQDAMSRAEDVGELDALEKMLEEKIQQIKMTKKKRKMNEVE